MVSSGQPIVKLITDAPVAPEICMPSGYALDREGVYRLVRVKAQRGRNASRREALLYTCLVVASRHKDITDNVEHFELAYIRDNQWRSHLIPRKELAHPYSIIKLANVGVSVNQDNARKVMLYLAECETQNTSLPVKSVSHMMGYQGEAGTLGFFSGKTLIPSESASDAAISFQPKDTGDYQVADGFHSKGSLDCWRHVIKGLMFYPLVMVGVYASLGSILLRILNVPSFCIEWWGRSSKGKTTTLKIAASCWGYPDEKSAKAAMTTWQATGNHLGRRLALLHNLPAIVDDTKKAARPETPSKMLYTLSSGRDKERATPDGLASSGTWELIMLSSGESSITSEDPNAEGATARVLSFGGVPFGSQSGDIAKFIHDVNGTLRENYGQAGPVFVSYLFKHRADWPCYVKRYEELRSLYLDRAGDNAKVGRLAEYFAVLVLTAELSVDALELQVMSESVWDKLWAECTDDVSKDSRAVEALSTVYDWVASNPASVYRRRGDDCEPNGGWIASWGQEVDWDCIYLIRDRLIGFLTQRGYEPRSIIKQWMELDILRFDAGRSDRKSFRIGSVGHKGIAIKREAIRSYLEIDE